MSGSHRAPRPEDAVVRVLGVALSDSTRRAVRTLLQLLLAVIPVLPTLALLTEGNPEAQAVIAAMIFYGTVVTKAINALEDYLPWWPAWLKAPASGGLHPEPDPDEV